MKNFRLFLLLFFGFFSKSSYCLEIFKHFGKKIFEHTIAHKASETISEGVEHMVKNDYESPQIKNFVEEMKKQQKLLKESEVFLDRSVDCLSDYKLMKDSTRLKQCVSIANKGFQHNMHIAGYDHQKPKGFEEVEEALFLAQQRTLAKLIADDSLEIKNELKKEIFATYKTEESVKQRLLQDLRAYSQDQSKAIGMLLELNEAKVEYDIAKELKQMDEEARKERDLAEYRRFNKMCQYNKDAIEGFGAVCSVLTDKKTAQQMVTYMTGADKVVQSLVLINMSEAAREAMQRTAEQMGSTAAVGAANPYVGLVMAIFTMASALMEDEDEGNATQAIMDGIRQLSAQMARYHEIAMERFDNIDNFLNEHHKATILKFFELHQENENLLTSIRELYKDLSQQNYILQGQNGYITQSVQSGFAGLQHNLRGLRTEEIDELIADANDQVRQGTMTNEQFADFTQKLYRKAVTRSKAEALTGSSVDVENEDEVCKALEPSSHQKDNMWAHKAFSNVNLLKRFVAKKTGQTTEDIVDPIIWMNCTQAIVNLFAAKLSDPSYPASQEDKEADLKKLEDLFKEGQKVLQFVEEIDQQRCIANLVNDYQKNIQEICSFFDTFTQKFEADRTREIQAKLQQVMELETVTLRTIPYEMPKYTKNLQEISRVISDRYSLYKVGWIRDLVKRYIDNGALGNYDECRFVPSGQLGLQEVKEIYNLTNGTTDPNFFNSKTLNKVEVLKKLYKNYEKYVSRQNKELLESIKICLFGQNCRKSKHITKLLYPANLDYSLVFLLPENYLIPISSTYLIAEQMGLGFIRHEYDIQDNNFYIYSYFVTTKNKQLIFNIRTSYTFNSFYSEQENLLHFWYGGRSVCKKDTLHMHDLHHEFVHTIHYPSVNPLPAQRDCLDAAEQLPVQDNSDKMETIVKETQRQNRIEFTKKLRELTQSSDNSELFKLLQNMDMTFKMLDCLLAFIYNENYVNQKNDLSNLQSITDVKNLKAVTKYLDEYNKSTELSEQFEECSSTSSSSVQQVVKKAHLPYYLKLTQNRLNSFVTRMQDYKAGFNAISSILVKLEDITKLYQAKQITETAISSMPKSLMDANEMELLRKKNNMLEQIILETRLELGEVKGQLAQILALLTQKNDR